MLILDGATGSELEARGVPLDPPLWSANAMVGHVETLTKVHQSYIAAGVHAVTANTFRCHLQNLEGTAFEKQSIALVATAVEIARRVAGQTHYVLGSQAPVADCYSPKHTPSSKILQREHQHLSAALAAAEVDGILVETMPTIREACIAVESALQTNLPVLVSVVCGLDGKLLSGESLSDAVRDLNALAPEAILVNCTPAPIIADLLIELRQKTPLPIGAYGNTGAYDSETDRWHQTDAIDPIRYADYAKQWIDVGATIVGGCCYTTPAHIAALSQMRC